MFAAIRFTGKLMKRRPLRTLLTILRLLWDLISSLSLRWIFSGGTNSCKPADSTGITWRPSI